MTKDGVRGEIIVMKRTVKEWKGVSRKLKKLSVVPELIITATELRKGKPKSGRSGHPKVMDLAASPPSPFSLTKIAKPTQNHLLHQFPPKLPPSLISKCQFELQNHPSQPHTTSRRRLWTLPHLLLYLR
jgi:hypothetical protein